MSSQHNQEFIDLFKAILVQSIRKEIKNQDPILLQTIFDKFKYQIRYYADIIGGDDDFDKKDKSQSFSDFIAARGDIIKLGPYDYMEFYKNLKDPVYLKSMKCLYEKCERLKVVKQDLMDAALYESSPDYIDAIPFYSYISLHGISLGDEEPLYKPSRINNGIQGQQSMCFRKSGTIEFYRHYTLWYMNQVLK